MDKHQTIMTITKCLTDDKITVTTKCQHGVNDWCYIDNVLTSKSWTFTMCSHCVDTVLGSLKFEQYIELALYDYLIQQYIIIWIIKLRMGNHFIAIQTTDTMTWKVEHLHHYKMDHSKSHNKSNTTKHNTNSPYIYITITIKKQHGLNLNNYT